MSIAVLIDDENRNDYVVSDSISISKVYGEPWTCDFETLDPLGAYYPNVGEQVQVVANEYVEEQILGDGSTQIFDLPSIPASLAELSITFNSTLPQTVGVYGVDTGKQWYWEVGTTTIHQDPGDPPMSPPDYIDTAYYKNIIVFGGLVRTVDRLKQGSFMDLLRTRVNCTDWNQLLERRLTGEKTWLAKTCGEIIADINTLYLDGEGFDAVEFVGAGPTLDSFQVNYAYVSDALNELRALATTGTEVYQLYVDEERRIVFRLDEAVAASFTIPDDAANISDLVVKETDEDYTNYVVGRVGESLRPEQSETLDLTAAELLVAFPIASTPTITVNGVPNTVGIASIDEDRDWYWSKGSKEIRQNPNNTPVTELDVVVVTYVGIESIYVLAQDEGAIAARAEIEGGSGRHDKLIEIDQMLSRGDAQAIVDGYLYSHIDIPLIATFETNDWIEPQARNLKPGTFLTILQAGWATSEDPYTVRSIRITVEDLPGSRYDRFRYQIEAFKGSRTKTVFQWFKDLAGAGNVGGGGSTDPNTEYCHFFEAGCAALEAGTDIAKQRPHTHEPGSVQKVTTDCKVAPVSDLQYNILVSRDAGATFDSIFTAGIATHPSGITGPVSYYGFSDAAKAMPKHSKFRLDVFGGGNAEGFAVKIGVRRIVTAPGQMAGSGNTTGITGVRINAPLAATVV